MSCVAYPSRTAVRGPHSCFFSPHRDRLRRDGGKIRFHEMLHEGRQSEGAVSPRHAHVASNSVQYARTRRQNQPQQDSAPPEPQSALTQRAHPLLRTHTRATLRVRHSAQPAPLLARPQPSCGLPARASMLPAASCLPPRGAESLGSSICRSGRGPRNAPRRPPDRSELDAVAAQNLQHVTFLPNRLHPKILGRKREF